MEGKINVFMEKPFYKIVDEICKEKNIEQNILSFGWIRELKKNNKIHHLIRYQFDLNSANSYIIAGDKFATYAILFENNIPIIKHKMIFNPKTRSVFYSEEFIKEAQKLLVENNNKIVIKSNDSTEGKGVFFCRTNEEIRETILKLFEENKDTLSACPYVDIEFEYRAIYLDGEILYVYKKKKPYVVGNGKDNLKELIEEKFAEFQGKIDIIKELDLNYIPKDGEEIIVSWKHNLSCGAEPILVENSTDPYLEKIKEIAKNAGDAISIRFASVDIALTVNKEIYVMEINGSVCMTKFIDLIPNGYEIAKNIYTKAIDKMFE